MRDMFGNEVTVEEAKRLLKAKAKPQKRGYAAPPGTGPVGETCKTCGHYRSVNGGSKSFPKCNLMRASWNHSYGSDILAQGTGLPRMADAYPPRRQ